MTRRRAVAHLLVATALAATASCLPRPWWALVVLPTVWAVRCLVAIERAPRW